MAKEDMELAESLISEIEADIRELEEDFGPMGLDTEEGFAESDSPELAELEAAIAGTEFDIAVSSEPPSESLLAIADDVSLDSDEEFFGGIVKKLKKIVRGSIGKKAKAIVKKVVKLVKKYKKLAGCAPAVTAAVVALKAGKYGTALKSAYAAYKCIKKKL